MFYYKFQNGRFGRHVLSYSYLEPYFKPGSKELPPNYVIGVGIRFSVGDLDGNGKPDIAVACRSGLYVFFNNGYTTMPRTPSPLPGRESYPGNTPFGTSRPAQKKQ